MPPNPTVTTARMVVAPSDWLMRYGHVIYLGLGLSAESNGDDGEDGGGALRLVDAMWSRDTWGLALPPKPTVTTARTVVAPSDWLMRCGHVIPGAWPCRRNRR